MKTSTKAAPSVKARISSTKMPKETFEDDREREALKGTSEGLYYASKNPPTRAEILEQARRSGFVPTLAGKPIRR
jgi:hypothetical protein